MKMTNQSFEKITSTNDVPSFFKVNVKKTPNKRDRKIAGAVYQHYHDIYFITDIFFYIYLIFIFVSCYKL